MLICNFESFSFSFPSSFLTARVSCTVESSHFPFVLLCIFLFLFPLLFPGLGVVSVFGYFFQSFSFISSFLIPKMESFPFFPPLPPSSTKGMLASTSALVYPALSCITSSVASSISLSRWEGGQGSTREKITLFLALSYTAATMVEY